MLILLGYAGLVCCGLLKIFLEGRAR